MLLIRRLWLLPFVSALLILYYLFYQSRPTVRVVTANDKLQVQRERYPVKNLVPLPPGSAKALPRIQHDFHSATETEQEKSTRLGRQTAIKDAFVHSWKGYKTHAWRADEVAPLSGRSRNSFGGWGASLVDAMDTLWIMGLKKDFEDCVRAIQTIDFTTNTEQMLNVFETTIRYLGGLLSAYDVSEHRYPEILAKAVGLAEILYMTFDTPNRYPVTRWHWRNTIAGMPLKASKSTLLAEIGSMSVEFTRLAQLTGDSRWFDAIDRITGLLYETQDTTQIPGLWPTIVDAETGTMTYNHFTLGGMADSTSEYLPKQFMLLGGLDDRYATMYHKLMTASKEHLFYRPLVPPGHDIIFSGNAALGEDNKVFTEPQGQHLTCFAGGMVGLAAKLFERPEELQVARRLVDGCIWAYNSTVTGLMPETFHLASCHVGSDPATSQACEWSETKWFEAIARKSVAEVPLVKSLAERGKDLAEQLSLPPGFTAWGDNRYILRPEAIESVFIMYRLTGDRAYMDIAWNMWNSIDHACRSTLAFAAISDVRVQPPAQSDRMESFWLAETLKYFYLIFADPSEWSLDDWVLNTEAHFLQRPKAGQPLTSKGS